MADQSAGSRPHVLLVDDVPDITLSQRWLLEQAGYEVSEANSAIAALDLVEAQAFDVVILDIAMPGVNGLDLCQRLKAHPACQTTRFVAHSGLWDDATVKTAFAAGFDRYVLKPVQLDDLLAIMEALGCAAPVAN
jgi:CheY-like chemotaxis protein